MEFSILRATSVSSCEGEAPGSVAVTITVGRSMSGKFWIFIARNAIAPASVSRMKSRIAGIGLRIDQDETFIVLLGAGGGLSRLDDSHQVSVGEERRPARDYARVGLEATRDLDAIADAAPGVHLHLRDAVVGLDAVDIAEALAHHHGRLRQREGAAAAELELAAREHAGACRARLRQVDVDDGIARLRVDGRRHHAHL